MEEGLRLATLRLPTGRTSTGSPLQLGPSQRHWRSGSCVGARVAHTTDGSVVHFHQTCGVPPVVPLFAAGSFHRAHFNGQLQGANDGTGSARRSAHLQERTGHARKEGLRSAILRLPRRDENAQRLCSPLAPRRAIWGAGIHALVPVTGAHRRCAARCRIFDSAAFHLGQQDPFTWLHGSQVPRWHKGAWAGRLR